MTGGGGVWGEVAMPAHPDISETENSMIVQYIQSLVMEDVSMRNSLPARGTIMPENRNSGETMLLTASYTDKGNGSANLLKGSVSIALRHQTLNFTESTKNQGMTPVNFNSRDLLLLPDTECWFVLEGLDLTGINSAILTIGWMQPPESGIDFEMRLNDAEGDLIGKGSMPKPVPGQPGGQLSIQLEKEFSLKNQDVYFVHKPREDEDRGGAPVALLNTTFLGGE